jgi:hypothetical protein
MVWLFEQRKKTENINVEYVFCDTGAEHPLTYKFIRDVVENWGIELTCLRTKITNEKGVGASWEKVSLDSCKYDLKPFTDSILKYSTPTIAGPKCTDRMKSTPSDKYCNETYGKKNYIKWLGMRIDEPNRIKKVDDQLDMFSEKTSKEPPVNIDYLATISDFEKQDVLDWWAKQPFDLQIPEHLGNCVFCIKKGAEKLALAARQEPELRDRFIEMVNLPEIPKKPSYQDLPSDIMYRGHHSLETIIESFKDVETEQLERIIKYGKRNAAESCTESCEATFSMDFELEILE